MSDIEDNNEAAQTFSDAERELTRLWRAWRTVHEMCQDRVCAPRVPHLVVAPIELVHLANSIKCLAQGYELSEEEVRISLDDFRDKFADPHGAPE